MARLAIGEFLCFALVFTTLAVLGYRLGYRGYLEPIMARTGATKAEITRVYAQKQWVRSLMARTRQMDRKIKALVPAVEELQTHLVRDEGDRIKLTLARDQAVRALRELAVSADPAVPPVKATVRVPVDPNEQLNRLKQTFLRANPRAVFPRWAVPSTIDVVRHVDRITVDGSFKDILRFVTQVETDPLLIQVTDVKLTLSPGPGDAARASIELSTPSLPSDEGEAQ